MVFDEFSKEQIRELGLIYVYNCIFREFRNMSKENFKLLEDKDFRGIRHLGEARVSELIWFRDYLNGKVDGKYEKREAVKMYKNKIYEERIEKHIEKERELREKIKELQDENRKIRQENIELRKNDRIIEKLKEVLNCT